MKLYTEEQVMKILFTTKQWGNLSNDYLIATVTPIELPSDEEIDKQGFQVPYDGTNEFYDKSFIKGAKWMKEQILNQNK
jgi:hypothetical protein